MEPPKVLKNKKPTESE